VRGVLAALLAFLAGVGLAAIGLVVAPAGAGEVCHTVPTVIHNPDGTVTTSAKRVCTDDGSGGSGGGEAGGGGAGPRVCTWGGHEIDCVRGAAVWVAGRECYARDVTSEYEGSRGDLGIPWEGHSGGLIFLCVAGGDGTLVDGVYGLFWVASAPVVPPVDGAVVAQKVVSRMPLAVPVIHLAPQPPLLDYVGLETWLWTDPAQWGALSDGVSVSRASVRVTATPVAAGWDMGDGSGTRCGSPGRVWENWMGERARTDCSYTYQRVSDFEPGGVFGVAVRLFYRVDWTCTGNCITGSGSLGEVTGRPATGTVRVGERQTVIVPNPN
jgi:hypothetical protein